MAVTDDQSHCAWAGKVGRKSYSIIVLEDGSIWEVDAGDQATAAAWTDATSITVNESEGSGYELVNTDDHELIHANYIGDE
jgi:hypothetical protein